MMDVGSTVLLLREIFLLISRSGWRRATVVCGSHYSSPSRLSRSRLVLEQLGQPVNAVVQLVEPAVHLLQLLGEVLAVFGVVLSADANFGTRRRAKQGGHPQ